MKTILTIRVEDKDDKEFNMNLDGEICFDEFGVDKEPRMQYSINRN